MYGNTVVGRFAAAVLTSAAVALLALPGGLPAGVTAPVIKPYTMQATAAIATYPHLTGRATETPRIPDYDRHPVRAASRPRPRAVPVRITSTPPSPTPVLVTTAATQSPPPVPQPSPSVTTANPPPVTSSPQDYALSLVGAAQFACLLPLWTRESGWNVYATNPSSGAYGIPQALPGDKMASAGADWQTNPDTQINWGLSYISATYGTPCGAWAHEEADGWY